MHQNAMQEKKSRRAKSNKDGGWSVENEAKINLRVEDT